MPEAQWPSAVSADGLLRWRRTVLVARRWDRVEGRDEAAAENAGETAELIRDGVDDDWLADGARGL
jgi:hypothetical protein